MSSIDWGDAPTWIGTVFAAAAFTLATLLSQRRQIQDQQAFIGEQLLNLRAEREALAAAAGERRSAQARQVTLRTRLLIGPEGHETRTVAFSKSSSQTTVTVPSPALRPISMTSPQHPSPSPPA